MSQCEVVEMPPSDNVSVSECICFGLNEGLINVTSYGFKSCVHQKYVVLGIEVCVNTYESWL